MSSDRLIEFEESNFEDLVEKFIHLKSIEHLWCDFVYQEYVDSLRDIEAPEHKED
jgi:hypothetical protein